MAKHILIIDDDPVLLAKLSDQLSDAGYRVTTMDCGVYSNHVIYGSDPPDLILLDVIMPHMSGVKKSKLIKQREKSAHIPIILMSSKDEAELSALADDALADDSLCKPIVIDRLVAKIEALLA